MSTDYLLGNEPSVLKPFVHAKEETGEEYRYTCILESSSYQYMTSRRGLMALKIITQSSCRLLIGPFANLVDDLFAVYSVFCLTIVQLHLGKENFTAVCG